MSDQNDRPAPQRRRMSLVDMFGGRSNVSSSPPTGNVTTTPDAAQHKRNTSISTLGLSGASPGQTSPLNAFAKQRRASISTSSASSSPEFRNSFGDEPAVIEEDDTSRTTQGSPPSPSFARRVSFGAQALRDVRSSNTGGPGGAGEGFNWSESLRDKTKRTPSFSSGNPFGSGFARSKSSSVVPTSTAEPPKEMPKPMSPPGRMKKPDHLGERMLRGDFMMD